jgi:hypothetical protein
MNRPLAKDETGGGERPSDDLATAPRRSTRCHGDRDDAGGSEGASLTCATIVERINLAALIYHGVNIPQ